MRKNCIICDSEEISRIGTIVGYPGDAVYCNNCNSVFPANFPSEVEIEAYYQGFEFNKPSTNKIKDKILRYAFIRKCRNIKKVIQKYHTGSKLLDFGGGCGLYSRGFMDIGYEVKLIDVDEQALQVAKELGVTTSKISSNIDKFDIVFSSHVIEHYKDLNVFFRLIDDLIKSGGLLVVACPNKDSREFYRIEYMLSYKTLINEVSLLNFIRNPWWCFDPPRHFYGISKKTIEILASRHGYDVLEKFTEYSTRYSFCHNDMYKLFSLSNIKKPHKFIYCAYVKLCSFLMSCFFKHKMFGDNLVVVMRKR